MLHPDGSNVFTLSFETSHPTEGTSDDLNGYSDFYLLIAEVSKPGGVVTVDEQVLTENFLLDTQILLDEHNY